MIKLIATRVDFWLDGTMNQDMSSFVERYQLIFEKDPDSKVFAPLAEAYRRMGLLDEAIDLAEKGIKKHPHFSSGRVALGKCYAQKNMHEKAIENLKVAVDLSPENILAQQLLAESYLKLNLMDKALQAYKMILFLNPNDTKAAGIVKKLEKDVFFAEPKENIKEEFSMEKLHSVKNPDVKPAPEPMKLATVVAPLPQMERELALLDTRFDRGEWKEARDQLNKLSKKFPGDGEVKKRLDRLTELESGDSFFTDEWITPVDTKPMKKQVKTLENLLSRIESRRRS